MLQTLTNERLRELIPNVLHEVKGEPLLYDKLLPWLESAWTWLQTYVVGHDFYIPFDTPLRAYAEKLVVFKAFADAVPSLDLALTPAGMSVINSEGRAPASKERVERLIASLRSFVEANLPVFQRELAKNDAWRASERGEYYFATFMPYLDDARAFCKGADGIVETYERLRAQAVEFERAAAASFLGFEFMARLRTDTTLAGAKAVVASLRNAETKYIANPSVDMWHVMQPVLLTIRTVGAEMYNLWRGEMGEFVELSRPTVKKQGGFCF